MQEISEKTKAASLKDLLSILREANDILETSEAKLCYLASGSPQDVAKQEANSDQIATLEILRGVANSIRRRSNNVAGYTNTIVGN